MGHDRIPGKGAPGRQEGSGGVFDCVPYLALVRIRRADSVPTPLDWLDAAAEQYGAQLLKGEDVRLYTLDNARACLDFGLLVHTHRPRQPVMESATVVFGSATGLGVSARAARLESLAQQARPGALFAVGSVCETLAPVTGGMRTVKLGTHRFDDMLPAEEVVSYSVELAIEPGAFNLKGLDLYDHNLPILFDSFVGRDNEIDEVIGAASTTRLVSLVGCGGVGKTRLAIHSTARLMQDGFDVLRLVRLAEADCGADIAPIVTTQSGIQSARFDDLVSAYKSKRCLFILDNCEHVLESVVAVVRRMVSELPGSIVLVTSREALDVGGEVAIEVSPLALPPEECDTSSVQCYGAVELFLDRLSERASDFRCTDAALSIVASICRKLDGLPLALEHAAGQASCLGIAECDRGLERRFELLRSERRDYESRHRTVWATIDWSYALLGEGEQRCLASLSEFIGAFSLSDAASLVADEIIDAAQVPSLLSSLTRKSLLVRTFDARGDTTFHLLETVREFAREKAHDRSESLRARHYELVRRLVVGAYDGSEGRDAGVRFSDLRPRYADVKAVMERAIAEKEPGIGEVLRCMTRYWIEYGPIADGVELLSRISHRSFGVEANCDVANALGAMLWMDGQFDQARHVFQSVLLMAKIGGEEVTAANAHNNLAGLAMSMGEHSIAEEHLRTAYETYLRCHEEAKAAMCAGNLGHWLVRRGRCEEALALMSDVLLIVGSRVSIECELVLLLNVSDAQRIAGRNDEALNVIREVLEKCALQNHLSTVPKAILRACVIMSGSCDPQDIAFLYGIASQGFAEFSSVEFSERGALRQEAELYIGLNLDPSARSRWIAAGSVVHSTDRAKSALEKIGSALLTGK